MSEIFTPILGEIVSGFVALAVGWIFGRKPVQKALDVAVIEIER